jgi:hypothetical protein
MVIPGETKKRLSTLYAKTYRQMFAQLLRERLSKGQRP